MLSSKIGFFSLYSYTIWAKEFVKGWGLAISLFPSLFFGSNTLLSLLFFSVLSTGQQSLLCPSTGGRCSAQVHRLYFLAFLFGRYISWSNVGQMLHEGLWDHHFPCQFWFLLSSATSEPSSPPPHGTATLACLPRVRKKEGMGISCPFSGSRLCALEAGKWEHGEDGAPCSSHWAVRATLDTSGL